MNAKQAKRLVGRKIVAVDLGGRWEGDGGCRVWMHDPTITLDDGSRLRFVVEEHPIGADYGVSIVRRPPPIVRRPPPKT